MTLFVPPIPKFTSSMYEQSILACPYSRLAPTIIGLTALSQDFSFTSKVNLNTSKILNFNNLYTRRMLHHCGVILAELDCNSETWQ